MASTLFWHDYETGGTDPARDRILQFAGQRTDLELNPIGAPVRLFCQPDPGLLPHPAACLITGISPQQALREGVSEPEFAARVQAELGAPGTCGVGYNSLRFDDEFTRFLLYRNFYDPYEREWRHGNSRWDIIDMLRLARALRPQGIQWPDHPDGSPSFRLEDLAAANGIAQERAHDALDDVLATIALARLVRERQPQLYAHLFDLRTKQRVQALLDPAARRPILHVSGRLPRERGYVGLLLPLLRQPGNANGVVCFDLMGDAEALLRLDAEAIRARVFSPVAELPEGVERLPLKTIHLNRCPVVLTPRLLDRETAARLHIDLARCERHWRLLAGAELDAKLAQVFAPQPAAAVTDADTGLYAGFLAEAERPLLATVRSATAADALTPERVPFRDPRYRELLFRYRAHHFPASLNPLEQENWRELRRWRLTDPGSRYLGLAAYRAELDRLIAEGGDPERRALLATLAEWGDRVAADCGLGADPG